VEGSQVNIVSWTILVCEGIVVVWGLFNRWPLRGYIDPMITWVFISIMLGLFLIFVTTFVSGVIITPIIDGFRGGRYGLADLITLILITYGTVSLIAWLTSPFRRNKKNSGAHQ